MAATDTQIKTRPGRKPRFDRAATVAQIADLFWAKGYDGVALSDVMAATGLSKSSLYNSFGDKDDLFRIALSHYHDGVVEAGAEWLASDEAGDPWDVLDQLLSGPGTDTFDGEDRRGCFLCNTAADGQSHAEEIDALVGQGFTRLTEGVDALLARAAPGTPPATRLATARLVVTTYAGMRVRSRHVRNRSELDDVRKTLTRIIRDSLPHAV